jgi:type IV pilus assembly protein PilV
MVSLLVMTVGMLGLLRVIDLSLKENLRNQLRDEAVRVGEQYLSVLKGIPFEEISSSRTLRAARTIRGVPFDYRVESSTQVLGDDIRGPSSKQLTVVVKWAYRNVTSQTTATSVVAR